MKENILAIPSSKEFFKDEALALLKDSGLQVSLPGRALSDEVTLPEVGRFTVALIKSRDIVRMVASGQIPIGIAGSDTIREYERSWRGKSLRNENIVQQLLNLGIGRCRLVIAAPKAMGRKAEEELRASDELPLNGFPETIRGLSIATSYPKLTYEYFSDWEATCDIDGRISNDFKIKDDLTGSVEVAPALGMSDLVSDLVETGRTLEDNDLKELVTIFESEGVLITNFFNKKGENRLVDAIRDRLFDVLLRRGNPDALRRKAEFEAYVASWR